MSSGMAAVQRRREMQARKARIGKDLARETTEQLSQAAAEFKASLEQFALQHRQAIRDDPEFRAHFHAMCASMGVDPLASNKGSVSKLLNFGDWSFASFYYELGVAVVEVCMATRAQNGGLIELEQLTRLVQDRRGHAVDKVTSDDVLQAVSKLQALDTSFTVTPDPRKARRGRGGGRGGKFYVNSVPREIGGANLPDVLAAAGEGDGCVTLAALAARPTWTAERAELVLQGMVAEGTCLIDDGDPSRERRFWFPVLAEQGAAL